MDTPVSRRIGYLSVCGVELMRQSVSLAQSALIGAPFSRADIEPFPRLDDPFDLTAS